MEQCNQCIQQNTYPPKLIKNQAFIAESINLQGEDNKTKAKAYGDADVLLHSPKR